METDEQDIRITIGNAEFIAKVSDIEYLEDTHDGPYEMEVVFGDDAAPHSHMIMNVNNIHQVPWWWTRQSRLAWIAIVASTAAIVLRICSGP